MSMKFDDGKLSYSLLDRAALAWTAAVLTYGAVKYERENWRTVPDHRVRYYDALLRHLEAWRGGELYDDETSLPHLAHMTCCAMMLLGRECADLSELPARLRTALAYARKLRSERESRQAATGSAPPPVR